MKPYCQDRWVTQYCNDALKVLPELPEGSIDLLATDPPYGIGFMGKDWDKALPDKRIWRECYRVLKDGAFAFVMSIPRADCLSRMIISLEDAGFWVNFTPIFWAYASGFPKAMNMSKAVQKLKMGVPQGGSNPLSPSHGKYKGGCSPDNVKGQGFGAGAGAYMKEQGESFSPELTDPQAKALDGSYGGFQPKPAVEVIIVAMKPLSEKTFVDQALKNRKGITWLDDGRIPYESDTEKDGMIRDGEYIKDREGFMSSMDISQYQPSNQGRFPANLLVSDDVLNDGKGHRVGEPQGGYGRMGIGIGKPQEHQPYVYQGRRYKVKGFIQDNSPQAPSNYADSGSFSRYFDLDKWTQKTFPFLIVPKASKSEKNRGLDYKPEPIKGRDIGQDIRNVPQKARNTPRVNQHPTVKPLKLMSYLITLGSREGDIVLDPFVGSGTTCLAAKLLGRKCIGIDIKEENCEIAARRCSQEVMELV